MALFADLDALKRRYFDETHPTEKTKLRAQIEQLIGLLTNGMQDFDFNVYFHEVFEGRGGFDVVIGNPPYVRQELIGEHKPALKAHFPEVYQGTADLYVYFYAKG
ncbi:Eco57I restriction-modification methylase domain-containing protein [Candidatus Amarolinea dominans]|uniref:Eco57I restriction-modification methylase domain-containing protein n=1 Tax=Candidatus Amarolinea dominans TaxID=3140696 RepID=UPI001E12740A|nr:Eco57I restriction-modification methylase domain-containing protein [Anaerolineae bacterium]